LFVLDLHKPILALLPLATGEYLEQRLQIGVGRQSVVASSAKQKYGHPKHSKGYRQKSSPEVARFPLIPQNEQCLEPQRFKAFLLCGGVCEIRV